ncbi:hypothetical protein B0H14DRAFT_2591190 [Mycena olivaceomarginata]|nr:hypothetical protein B0H14DRAFT_2591190 [Mycena olivaceomarginata]
MGFSVIVLASTPGTVANYESIDRATMTRQFRFWHVFPCPQRGIAVVDLTANVVCMGERNARSKCRYCGSFRAVPYLNIPINETRFDRLIRSCTSGAFRGGWNQALNLKMVENTMLKVQRAPCHCQASRELDMKKKSCLHSLISAVPELTTKEAFIRI